MRFPCIRTMDDLAELTAGIGFLPYFANGIPGWSVEENIDPAVWFTDAEGPWEWKGPLARDRRLVYGKFFRRKAAFVSLTCFPDLCNYRRDGYDFEGRCDDSLAPHGDRLLMAFLEKHGPATTLTLRREAGLAKGFETSLARLQTQTYITARDFVYDVDRHGRPYGWGKTLWDTADRWLGEEVTGASDRYPPEESLERIVRWLHGWMPDVGEDRLREALR